MKHIPWPSIGQFRNVVKNVEHKSSYIGMDDFGDPIYNKLLPKPKLKFEGTVKLHGTCSMVVVPLNGKYWMQSRSKIITPEQDNAGFAMFAHTIMPIFESIASNACKEVFADPTSEAGVRELIESLTGKDLVIFGEWCGGSIQKGVALNQLPKMFVIFGIAFVDAEGQKTYLTRNQVENAVQRWVCKPNTTSSNGLFCIYDFDTFNIEIDFENPHEAQNILNKFTDNIEKECPVGRAFGVSGIGEGAVWRCVEDGYEDSGFWFKVKGAEHSKSKVKTLATVDVEKINNIRALAEQVAHEGRLQQQFDLVFDALNGGEADIKKMGELIKAVMQDIFKEELDVIAASGFSGKELNGPVSKLVREFLLKKLEV